MECEGSAFTHMKKRLLSSLYQRENSENSLLFSLFVFCKKKRPEAKRRFFFSLLQLFFSSFVLSRKIMEKKGNFIVFSSSSPQTS